VDLAVLATTVVLIFPAELPDKTFVASLVLSTRYPHLPVWLGVSAAFFVQCLLAVTAGGLLTLLPRTPVLMAASTLFTVGAIVLFRTAGHADADEAAEEKEFAARVTRPATGLRAASTSFLVLLVAEFGDLSQLLTAGLVVRFRDPVSVFAGSWAALVTVAGLAILVGRALLRRVRLATVRRLGGTVCGVLAVLTLLEALGASPI
jgi:Ca2+/H+ antiporter, TMEM165/GDT1 family